MEMSSRASIEPITIGSSINSLEAIPENDEMTTTSFMVRSHTLPNKTTILWFPHSKTREKTGNTGSIEDPNCPLTQSSASLPSLLPSLRAAHRPRLQYRVPAPLYRARLSTPPPE